MKHEKNFTIDEPQVAVIRAPGQRRDLVGWLGLGTASSKAPAGWTPDPVRTWL